MVRVFCLPDGTGGNPLGVFLEGAAIAQEERQPIAHELGFSETVYVDDRERGEMRIFTPRAELRSGRAPAGGDGLAARREGVRRRSASARRPAR